MHRGAQFALGQQCLAAGPRAAPTGAFGAFSAVHPWCLQAQRACAPLGDRPHQVAGRWSPSPPVGDRLGAAYVVPSQNLLSDQQGCNNPPLDTLLFSLFICLQTSINLPLASSQTSDEEQPFLVFTAKFNPCFLCLVLLNLPCPSRPVFPSCGLSPRVSVVPFKSWFASVLSLQIFPVYFL